MECALSTLEPLLQISRDSAQDAPRPPGTRESQNSFYNTITSSFQKILIASRVPPAQVQGPGSSRGGPCGGLFVGPGVGKSRIWGVPGASWGRPGASWGRLGASWGRLGGVLGPLGASWGLLGRSWGHLGAIFGVFTRKAAMLQNYRKTQIRMALGPSKMRPSWHQLGSSWHLNAILRRLAASSRDDVAKMSS